MNDDLMYYRKSRGVINIVNKYMADCYLPLQHKVSYFFPNA